MDIGTSSETQGHPTYELGTPAAMQPPHIDTRTEEQRADELLRTGSLGVWPTTATWAPVRAADFDTDAWGAWEVWEHCTIGPVPGGAIGAIRSGDWVAWDSASKAVYGVPGENARAKAEMFAVLRNEGRPTRVVEFDGSFAASVLVYADLKAKVEAEVTRIAELTAAAGASQE